MGEYINNETLYYNFFCYDRLKTVDGFNKRRNVLLLIIFFYNLLLINNIKPEIEFTSMLEWIELRNGGIYFLIWWELRNVQSNWVTAAESLGRAIAIIIIIII